MGAQQGKGGSVTRSPSTPAQVKRAERRVINAAMRLAAAGGGFIFKDGTQRVADVGSAISLEKACAALAEARKK